MTRNAQNLLWHLLASTLNIGGDTAITYIWVLFFSALMLLAEWQGAHLFHKQ